MANIELRIEQLLKQLTLKEKVALLSGKDAWNTVAIERLGIPSLTMSDGPHGARRDTPTTAFPTGSALAATWNAELIERVGVALAEETLASNCDILLGPCVNIVRHPLAGRNFEAYSEDPYLAGRIGVAWVKGLQSKNVGASLKHFACNNQEILRFRGSSNVDERTLREIYLSQFEMIVKETNPWTVMCSYNRLNGIYASENRHLLTEILKDEWNYDGVVVSDWNANHTTIESVKHGLDLEMPGPARYYGHLLVEAVDNWQLDAQVIDNAARRLLRMIVRSGRAIDAPRPAGSVNTIEHQQLARLTAEESITLLKNENAILPLRAKSIAVIGPNAVDWQITGGGSSRVESPYRVSPLAALKAKLGDSVKVEYAQGCDNYIEPPKIKSEWLTLTLQVFDNADFGGEPVIAHSVPMLDQWWWKDALSRYVTFENFSARWSGKLVVPDTGRYVFKFSNSAHGRVFIDGQAVFDQDNSITRTASEHQYDLVELDFVGGRAYDLRVEFVKRTDDNFAFVHAGMERKYRPHEDQRIPRAVELAKRSDVALVFVGDSENYETEGGDRPHMDLVNAQNELVRAVAHANPNTVVVLNVGAPVTMPWIDEVSAIVLGYLSGMEGGNAVASVLCGEVNPSGKLPVTFPKRLQDTPAFVNYPGTREVLYGEGVFVGYRWYDARDIAPLFPFGHGLSYTTFEYGDLRAPQATRIGESIQIAVTIKNTGAVAGKEIVQVYVRDVESALARPPKELKRFAKVALNPGESQMLTFTLDERAFAFYDVTQARWVVEPGEFEILVGSSSQDIRQSASIKLM
ncbi:MAG: glycoside hydrolase family 3 C-terminal domain-containing protein [Chloroflexi bacterium]|nr:glycoside hydrolase family 3 C-terminal domain-containing protein [Chloroflexota bacterium]